MCTLISSALADTKIPDLLEDNTQTLTHIHAHTHIHTHARKDTQPHIYWSSLRRGTLSTSQQNIMSHEMNPTFLLSTAVGGVQGQVLGAILPSSYFFFVFYYPHSLSLFLQAVSLQKLPTDVNRGNQRCLREFSLRVLPSALNSGGVVSSFTVFSATSKTELYIRQAGFSWEQFKTGSK